MIRNSDVAVSRNVTSFVNTEMCIEWPGFSGGLLVVGLGVQFFFRVQSKT